MSPKESERLSFDLDLFLTVFPKPRCRSRGYFANDYQASNLRKNRNVCAPLKSEPNDIADFLSQFTQWQPVKLNRAAHRRALDGLSQKCLALMSTVATVTFSLSLPAAFAKRFPSREGGRSAITGFYGFALKKSTIQPTIFKKYSGALKSEQTLNASARSDDVDVIKIGIMKVVLRRISGNDSSAKACGF